MLSTISPLVLHSLQKAINTALAHDPVSQDRIARELGGKTLRIICQSPKLSVDVFFDSTQGKVYLEPTPMTQNTEAQYAGSQSAAQGMDSRAICPANCTLNPNTAAELVGLLEFDGGSLPLQGDYKVLYALKSIVQDAKPSTIHALSAWLPASMAGALSAAINSTQTQVKKQLDQQQFLLQEWLEDSRVFAKQHHIGELRKHNIALHTDLERLDARVDALLNKLNKTTTAAAHSATEHGAEKHTGDAS